MKLGDIRPELVLYGIGAALLLYAVLNPRSFGRALVGGAADVVGGAAAGVADGAKYSAQEYGIGALAAKAGQSVADSGAGAWLRSKVGLPSLAESQAACSAALAAGDDIAAMKYCGPLDTWRGLFDGR